MTSKKVCVEHVKLVERISSMEGKLSVLITLNVATIGLIIALKLI